VPQHAGLIQRVLAIPNKRHSRPLIGFLTRREIDALLAAPDRTTWLGRRDHALLLTAVQTGLRLAEITSIRQQDVSFGTGANIRCEGKGRKERCTSLVKSTVTVLAAWIREQGEDGSAQCRCGSVSGCEVRCGGAKNLSITDGSVFRLTFFGTQQPWNCCRLVWIVL
jgi:integrase/recombinase XerD